MNYRHMLRDFSAFMPGFGLSLLLLLSGCGGGGGAGGLPDAGSSQTTEVSGLYLGSAGSPGFWAVARGIGTGNYQFLAFNDNTAVVYSGQLIAGIGGNAESFGLKAMSSNGTVRQAQASFTQMSASGFRANFDAGTSDAATFQADAVSPSNTLLGSWTGSWVDELDVNGSVSLSNVAPGLTTRVGSSVVNCFPIDLTFGSQDTASGLYSVRVVYPSTQTGCRRQGTELNGLASVWQQGGRTYLRFAAVNASGSGISFRAER